MAGIINDHRDPTICQIIVVFILLLTCFLIILKLVNQLNESWFWIFSPLWFFALVVIVIAILDSLLRSEDPLGIPSP